MKLVKLPRLYKLNSSASYRRGSCGGWGTRKYGSPVTPEHLSERITAQGSLRVPLPAGAGTLKQARLTFEREYIAELLRQHQGNAAQTAKVLGLSRQMLQKKIKEYGLRGR